LEIGNLSREYFRKDAFSLCLGEIIKSRRDRLNLSEEDLAKMVGKTRPYISRVEKGEDVQLSNFALI
jgi:transcriptional regulator with XRE-family HTH domain